MRFIEAPNQWLMTFLTLSSFLLVLDSPARGAEGTNQYSCKLRTGHEHPEREFEKLMFKMIDKLVKEGKAYDPQVLPYQCDSRLTNIARQRAVYFDFMRRTVRRPYIGHCLDADHCSYDMRSIRALTEVDFGRNVLESNGLGAPAIVIQNFDDDGKDEHGHQVFRVKNTRLGDVKPTRYGIGAAEGIIVVLTGIPGHKRDAYLPSFCGKGAPTPSCKSTLPKKLSINLAYPTNKFGCTGRTLYPKTSEIPTISKFNYSVIGSILTPFEKYFGMTRQYNKVTYQANLEWQFRKSSTENWAILSPGRYTSGSTDKASQLALEPDGFCCMSQHNGQYRLIAKRNGSTIQSSAVDINVKNSPFPAEPLLNKGGSFMQDWTKVKGQPPHPGAIMWVAKNSATFLGGSQGDLTFHWKLNGKSLTADNVKGQGTAGLEVWPWRAENNGKYTVVVTTPNGCSTTETFTADGQSKTVTLY